MVSLEVNLPSSQFYSDQKEKSQMKAVVVVAGSRLQVSTQKQFTMR